MSALLILVAGLVAYGVAEVICRAHDRRNSPYRVFVEWEGDGYTHAAQTLDEALQWLGAYPASCRAKVDFMFHGRASFVARRWPT